MLVFDGFPYLVTRIVAGLYHLTVLPSELDDGALVEVGRAQTAANQLQIAVALSRESAVYFGLDGSVAIAPEPPRGGRVIAERLATPNAFPSTAHLRARQQALAEFVRKDSLRGGMMLSDLTKGGRSATPRERRDLAGWNEEGSPRGLERCEACGDWRGVCLDPAERFHGQVMTVHCRCTNHNRCARCGDPLYERRLNANYFDRAEIWHVPGFCGLSHICADPAARCSSTDRPSSSQYRTTPVQPPR
jgi:hypothetical protein